MANPYDAAQPYLAKQENFYNNLYQPLIDRGATAGNNAAGIYGQMATDPGAFYKQLEAGYTPHRGYNELKSNEAMRASQAAAAAGGYTGSWGDAQEQERLMNDLMEDDFRKYMDYVNNYQKQGLEGQTHYADLGQQAAFQFGENQGGLYANQGQLAYESAAQKEKNKHALINSLIQGGMGVLGGAVGGPAGAAIGSGLGSMFTGGGGGFTGNIGGSSLDAGNWLNSAGSANNIFGKSF